MKTKDMTVGELEKLLEGHEVVVTDFRVMVRRGGWVVSGSIRSFGEALRRLPGMVKELDRRLATKIN